MSTQQRSRPRSDAGYAVILVLLGIVTVQLAPTRAAQLTGLALIVVAALDVAICLLNRSHTNVTIKATGTYDANDVIPVSVVASRPLQQASHRLLLHHVSGRRRATDETVIESHVEDDNLAYSAQLQRGRYRALRYPVFHQSPLGLCALGRFAKSDVDLFVGPTSITLNTDELAEPQLELAGVRPAQSSDPRRLVHWPSTARAQELMVKERAPVDGEDATVFLIVLDLGFDQDDRSEEAARRARAYAERALGLGHQVQIMTATSSGRKSTNSTSTTSVTSTSVTSTRDVLRVLAQANGAISAPPTHDGRMVHVSQQGDQWSGS